MDRYLSSLDVWAMAFGCMVGWGAFVMPGKSLLPVAGPAGTILAMVIGLAVMLVIASSVSFLMNRSPRAGGVYSYTKEAFGRDHAFLCSWFLCLSYLTIVFLNGTALFLVIRTLMDGVSSGAVLYTVNGNPVYLLGVIHILIRSGGCWRAVHRGKADFAAAAYDPLRDPLCWGPCNGALLSAACQHARDIHVLWIQWRQ